jgi:uncharacterized NAD(P)/FAD-binding protein YdhS
MRKTANRIAIVGGGASGVIAAVNMVRAMHWPADIVVIERRANLGRGLAYSTTDPSHLLNVRAENMSAFANDPDHFLRWLKVNGPAYGIESPAPFLFVTRSIYGAYLESLCDEGAPHGIRVFRNSCEDVVELEDEVQLRLTGGSILTADAVVIATGHDPQTVPPGIPAIDPWSETALDGLASDAPVLVLGTGLTMTDVVLSLCQSGHRGPIIALSRRGLLSHAHAEVLPVAIARPEVPLGAPLGELVRWVRQLAKECESEGGNWRCAIDALRPHTRAIWQSMTAEQRRRFLRHIRPWWDVHRHRMAPSVAGLISRLINDGRLIIVRGRIVASETDGDRVAVTLRRRGAAMTEKHTFDRVINCTGLSDDPRRSPNPAIRALLKRGLARVDSLSIGLDVAPNNALVKSSGEPSRRVFAVGPLTRGTLWEIVAIPDIRLQCAELTGHLAAALFSTKIPAGRADSHHKSDALSGS